MRNFYRAFALTYFGIMIPIVIGAIFLCGTPATAKDRVTCGRGDCHEGIRPW